MKLIRYFFQLEICQIAKVIEGVGNPKKKIIYFFETKHYKQISSETNC